MRTIILLISMVSILTTNALGQKSLSAFSPESKKEVGLMAYLTSVKAYSEVRMLGILQKYKHDFPKDNLQGDSEAAKNVREALANYAIIKANVDILINQLSSDLYLTNHLKVYRKLEKYLAEGDSLPKKYTGYEELISEIDLITNDLLAFEFEEKGTLAFLGLELSAVSLEEITGVLTLGYTIAKDQAEARRTKISSLVGLLEKVRLVPPEKLFPSADKEKPSKEKEKDDD